MNKHTMTLVGGSHDELRVPADVLLEAVGALVEGARQATRFFVEGTSVRKGHRPAWLETVTRVEITGLGAGSCVVSLAAPALAEALPDRFGGDRQIALFPQPDRMIDTTSSAVDLFASVLAPAVEGDRDAVLADRALLDTCLRLVRAIRGGYDAIRIEGIAGRSTPLMVRADAAERIELLRDETPNPRAVRVTGMLDTISATSSEIVLKVAGGGAVTGRLEAHDEATLRRLFGTRVVVSGMAQFRPSGRVLAIDVESLEPAREHDAVFERMPSAVPRAVARLVPQDETSGVAAFFGTWPGDETDGELLGALKAIG